MKNIATKLVLTITIGVGISGILTNIVYATPSINSDLTTKTYAIPSISGGFTTPAKTNSLLSNDLNSSTLSNSGVTETINNISLINDIEDKIQICDSQIEASMSKITTINKQIEEKNVEIADIESKIKANQIEKDKNYQIYQDKVRDIYINGGTQSIALNYIAAIKTGTSLMDILDKIHMVSLIVQKDNDVINNEKSLQEELTKQNSIVIADEKKLSDSKISIENELVNINKNKDEQIKLLDEQNKLKLLAEQNQIVNKMVQTPFQISGTTSEVAKLVITEGEKYIGTPYVWGGTDPSGFDCSGFVQYIFNKEGIQIPRVAEDQQQVGITVPVEQIQPGDLVFFGDPAHHVGMYVGSGQFINAPHAGDFVKIEPLNLGSVSTVKRIIT